jgi:hypothetical protein
MSVCTRCEHEYMGFGARFTLLDQEFGPFCNNCMEELQSMLKAEYLADKYPSINGAADHARADRLAGDLNEIAEILGLERTASTPSIIARVRQVMLLTVCPECLRLKTFAPVMPAKHIELSFVTTATGATFEDVLKPPVDCDIADTTQVSKAIQQMTAAKLPPVPILGSLGQPQGLTGATGTTGCPTGAFGATGPSGGSEDDSE